MHKVSIYSAVELSKIFWPDFIEIDGSVFLVSGKPETVKAPDGFFDRTSVEAASSHTHIADLFAHQADRHPKDENDHNFFNNDHPDFQLLCKMGKILAEIWYQKLRLDFPQYDFRVYYTQEDNPIVRFHRVRMNEANWLDEEQYENDIRQGKIIVYDTRRESREPKRA